MRNMGLVDIDMRVSDRAVVIEGDGMLREQCMAAKGWDRTFATMEKDQMVQSLMNKGLQADQASLYVEMQQRIQEYFLHHEDAGIVWILGLLISFGRKPRFKKFS